MDFPLVPYFVTGGYRLFFWKSKKKKHDIFAPVSGKAITLEGVGDGVFSEKLVGDGIAVIPDDDQVVVPVTGKVSFVMETGHAFGVKMPDGPEVLVHIGIDTVNEKGQGFKVQIQENQQVEIGTPAVRVDRAALEKKGYNLSVMVLIPDVEQYGNLEIKAGGEVRAGEQVVLAF